MISPNHHDARWTPASWGETAVCVFLSCTCALSTIPGTTWAEVPSDCPPTNVDSDLLAVELVGDRGTTVLEEDDTRLRVRLRNLTSSSIQICMEPDTYRVGYLKLRVFDNTGARVPVTDDLPYFFAEQWDLALVKSGSYVERELIFHKNWLPASRRCEVLQLSVEYFCPVDVDLSNEVSESSPPVIRGPVVSNSIAICVKKRAFWERLFSKDDCCLGSREGSEEPGG